MEFVTARLINCVKSLKENKGISNKVKRFKVSNMKNNEKTCK